MIRMKGDRLRDDVGKTLENKWRLAPLKLLNAIRKKTEGKGELPVSKKKREKVEEIEEKIEVNWESIGSDENEFKDSKDSSSSEESDSMTNQKFEEGDFILEKEKEEDSYHLKDLFELTPPSHYEWALSEKRKTLTLKEAFVDHGYRFPSDVNIEEIGEHSWMIESDDFTFLVEKERKSGTTFEPLKVYLKWNYIFSVKCNVPISDIDQTHKYFESIFREYGAPLSEDFDLISEDEIWFIDDGDSKFLVDLKKSGMKLHIYRKKSIEPEGSIPSTQENEIAKSDRSNSASVDSRSDDTDGKINEHVKIDWGSQEPDKRKESISSSDTEKSEEMLIKIPDTILNKCLKEMDVEEQLLLFGKKEENGDFIVWRTEKPELEEHTEVFSSCDSKSLHEYLKSCEEYGDSFVGLIHKHPSKGEQFPSFIDKKTTDNLPILYSKLFSGIVDSNNTVLTVFFESEDTKLKVVGNDVKERGEKNGRKFWKVE